MTPNARSPALYEDSGFEAVLNSVCGRLEDKQIEFSIRRLREMEERLGILEQELDDFILAKAEGPAGSGCLDGVPGVKADPVTRNAE
jgi:hypothetical protein